MQRNLIVLSFIIFTLFSFSHGLAQNVGINESGSTPHQSAILDVESTTKGLLIPRMSESERDLITAPEIGLLVFQTNNNSGFYYFDGTNWVNIFSGWKTTGNTGTNSTDNYVGTSDDENFAISTNGNRAVRVFSDATSPVGTEDNGVVEVHNRILVGESGRDGYPSLNGSIKVGAGAPDIFNGGISLYSNMTTSNHYFQGGIRMHNATTTTNTSNGGGLISLRGYDLSLHSFGTSGNIVFHTQNTGNGIERFRLANNGRVGIGDFSASAPNALLHLRGASLNFFLENTSGNTYTINSTNAGDLRFFRVGSGTFPLTIRGSNNFVGINNSAPNFNLHVSGQTRVDGTTMVNTSGGGSGLRVTHGSSGEAITISHTSPNWCILADVNGNIANLDQNGVWNNASDKRLKENVSTMDYGLREVLMLNPVIYTMKSSGATQVGFIAQEVDEIIPEVISHPSKEDGTDMLSMSYGNLVSVLAKAIQEQQQIIEQQQNQIDEQQTLIDAQQDKNESLEERFNQLSAEMKLLHHLIIENEQAKK